MTSPTGQDAQAGQPRSRYVKALGREVHFTEWGQPGGEPVVMWHGLARTGRDFDVIAAALSDRFHIICPDTIGRGLSEWSDRPHEDYCLDVYARLAAAIADAAGSKTLHWVGTSMGGALGIRTAATTLKADPTRVRPFPALYTDPPATWVKTSGVVPREMVSSVVSDHDELPLTVPWEMKTVSPPPTVPRPSIALPGSRTAGAAGLYG